MMKPFLPLSEKTRMEMEGIYPFFTTTQNELLTAVFLMPEFIDDKKQQIFQVLRTIESRVSAELGKLRSKPKRATKFCMCMKRLILKLKTALDSLPDYEQLQAYPTLSLICTYFIDTILSSSLADQSLPKFVSSNLSSFLKTLFNHDLEYVLDVLVCSNVFEDSESKKGVGYYMLTESIMDGHLYTHDISSFAKYLAILSFINENTDDHTGIVKNTLQELNSSKSATLPRPNDMRAHLKEKYNISLGKRVTWMEIMTGIKQRKISNVTRRQRLIVVSGKPHNGDQKKKKRDMADEINEDLRVAPNKSTLNDGNETSTSMFFIDRGEQGDGDDYQVSSTIVDSAQYDQEERLSQKPSTSSQMTNKYSTSPMKSSGYSLLPAWNDMDEGDKVIQPPLLSLSLNQSPTSNRHKSLNVGNNKETYENGLPILSPRADFIDTNETSSSKSTPTRSARTTSPRKICAVTTFPAQVDSDSESDLEVVFEATAPPKKKSIGPSSTSKSGQSLKDVENDSDDNDESDGSDESRDFAPSESGEDEIPHYSPTDFGHRYEDDPVMLDNEENHHSEEEEDTTNNLPVGSNDDALESLEVQSTTSTVSLKVKSRGKQRKSKAIIDSDSDDGGMAELHNATSATTNDNNVQVTSSAYKGKTGEQSQLKEWNESSPEKKQKISLSDGEADDGDAENKDSSQLVSSPTLSRRPGSVIMISPSRKDVNSVSSSPTAKVEQSPPAPRRMRTRSGSAEKNEAELTSRSTIKRANNLSPLKEDEEIVIPPTRGRKPIVDKGSPVNTNGGGNATRGRKKPVASQKKVVPLPEVINEDDTIPPKRTRRGGKVGQAASEPSSPKNAAETETAAKRGPQKKLAPRVIVTPTRTTRSTLNRTRGVKKTTTA